MANSCLNLLEKLWVVWFLLETQWFIFCISKQVRDLVTISYVSHSILYVCFKGQISDIRRFHSNCGENYGICNEKSVVRLYTKEVCYRPVQRSGAPLLPPGHVEEVCLHRPCYPHNLVAWNWSRQRPSRDGYQGPLTFLYRTDAPADYTIESLQFLLFISMHCENN